jgi:hypothetical protein
VFQRKPLLPSSFNLRKENADSSKTKISLNQTIWHQGITYLTTVVTTMKTSNVSHLALTIHYYRKFWYQHTSKLEEKIHFLILNNRCVIFQNARTGKENNTPRSTYTSFKRNNFRCPHLHTNSAAPNILN